MISLVVGFPGSGKTYYAINRIFDEIHKSKLSVDFIYTNISGLRVDIINEKKEDFCKKLDLDDLSDYLKLIHQLYNANKNKDDLDDILINYSKQRNYYNCLFIIDECHNFLIDQDISKIFWFTYHRHLFHEILLLTQNKTLIHNKYRGIVEIFIQAQPRSKKLTDSGLNYKFFSSFAMYSSDYYASNSIKTNQEVFNLYQSGNISKQKSIITKYLYIMILSFFVVVGIFYYIFWSLDNRANPKEIIESNKTNTQNFDNEVRVNYQTNINNLKDKPISSIVQKYDFAIRIIQEKDFFIINDRYYKSSYFRDFLIDTDSRLVNSQVVYKGFFSHILQTKKQLFDLYFIDDSSSHFVEHNVNKNKPVFDSNLSSGIKF